MRIVLVVALGVLAITLAGNPISLAQDKKDEKKTLEGTLTCTKCALKETAKCGHALIVKQDKKEVKYYLVDKGGAEPYHGSVCTSDVEKVKVTGKVVDKDGKKTIEEPKVELPKK